MSHQKPADTHKLLSDCRHKGILLENIEKAFRLRCVVVYLLGFNFERSLTNMPILIEWQKGETQPAMVQMVYCTGHTTLHYTQDHQ